MQALSRYRHSLQARHVLAFGIAGVALALRLPGLDKSIWLDEFFSMRAVNAQWLSPLLLALKIDQQLPAYFILLKLWSGVASTVALLRIPSVLLGVGGVVVIIAWLWQYSSLAAVLAGLVVATAPALLRFSQEIRDYSLLFLATALAFYFASRVLARPEGWLDYAGLAASLVLVVTTHLVGVMVLAPVLIFMASDPVRFERIRKWQVAVAFAIPGAIFAYIAFAFREIAEIQSKDFWMPHVSATLVQWVFSYLAGFSALSQSVADASASALVLAIPLDVILKLVIAAIGCMLVVYGQWRKSLPFVAAALVFYVQLLVFSVVQTSIFWYRTGVPGLVPLVGFVAMQTATIRSVAWRRVAVAGIGALCLVLAARWALVDAWIPVEDWRSATQFLESRMRDGDVLAVYPAWAQGAVGYYGPGLLANAVMIAPGEDLCAFDSTIERKVQAARDSGGAGIVLVIRADTSVEQDGVWYQRLLADLAAQPLARRSFLVVRSDTSLSEISNGMEQDALSALKREFGEPTQFEDHGSYVWMAF